MDAQFFKSVGFATKALFEQYRAADAKFNKDWDQIEDQVEENQRTMIRKAKVIFNKYREDIKLFQRVGYVKSTRSKSSKADSASMAESIAASVVEKVRSTLAMSKIQEDLDDLISLDDDADLGMPPTPSLVKSRSESDSLTPERFLLPLQKAWTSPAKTKPQVTAAKETLAATSLSTKPTAAKEILAAAALLAKPTATKEPSAATSLSTKPTVAKKTSTTASEISRVHDTKIAAVVAAAAPSKVSTQIPVETLVRAKPPVESDSETEYVEYVEYSDDVKTEEDYIKEILIKYFGMSAKIDQAVKEISSLQKKTTEEEA